MTSLVIILCAHDRVLVYSVGTYATQAQQESRTECGLHAFIRRMVSSAPAVTVAETRVVSFHARSVQTSTRMRQLLSIEELSITITKKKRKKKSMYLGCFLQL